jgi:hypothetical protein
VSLLQPLINPLFKTRAFQTSLIKWAGGATAAAPVAVAAANDSTVKAPVAAATVAAAGSDYETFVKNYWTSKLGSSDLWDKALQDGVIETTPLLRLPEHTVLLNLRKLHRNLLQ